jgi:hypothetical protein
MYFLILLLWQYDNGPPEVDSMSVLNQLLEQYHIIINIFHALKVRWADMDQSCDLFKQEPCLKSVNGVLDSLFTMYSVLDLAQTSCGKLEIFSQSVGINSVYHLARETTATQRTNNTISETIDVLREYLAEVKGDVKMMKGLLLKRIRDLEVSKRELEQLREDAS